MEEHESGSCDGQSCDDFKVTDWNDYKRIEKHIE
jgi:hypothetical protein